MIENEPIAYIALLALMALPFLFALIGYWAAVARGRGAAGALLGFCLGPIGILVALFLPSNPVRPQRPARRSRGSRRMKVKRIHVPPIASSKVDEYIERRRL